MGAYLPSRPVSGVVTEVKAPPRDVGVVPAGADTLDRFPLTLLKAGGVELLDVVGDVTSPPTPATKVPAELTTAPVLASTGEAAKAVEMSLPACWTVKPVPTSRSLIGMPRPVEVPRYWVAASVSIAIM